MVSRLKFRGRSRSITETIEPDIVCSEIINAMQVGDVIKPSITFYKEFSDIAFTYSNFYIHKVDTITNNIFIGYQIAKYYNASTYVDFSQTFANEVKISHIGNVLIFSDYTAGITYYSIFDVTTATYSDIFFLPCLSSTEISSIIFKGEINQGTASALQKNYDTRVDSVETIAAIKMALYDETIQVLYAKGEFDGFMLLRSAFRLFDGTYINATIPQLVFTGGDSSVHFISRPYYTTLYWEINGTYDPDTSGFFVLYSDVAKTNMVAKTTETEGNPIIEQNNSGISGTISITYSQTDNDSGNTIIISDSNTYTINGDTYNQIINLSLVFAKELVSLSDFYSGGIRYNPYYYSALVFNEKIIKSICVFAAKPINRRVAVNNSNIVSMVSNPLPDTYIDYATYFKVDEIPISEIGTLKNTWTDLKLGDLNNLETNEPLIVDANTNHLFAGNYLLNYNNRLLSGNIKTKLFNLFTTNYNIEQTANPNNITTEWYVEVVLETFEGTKTVWSPLLRLSEATPLSTKCIIGYPDRRATQINFIKLSYGGVYTITYYVNLKPHLTEDFAYSVVYDTDYRALLAEPFTDAIVETTSVVITERNNSFINDQNQVKASLTNNPFVFLFKNTYQVGNSRITALTTQAQSIGPAQYGQYPIIVFTESGISTMNISTAEGVFIDAIRDLSTEILVNEKSFINVGSSIFFISNKGIMVLSGQQITCLTEDFYNQITTNTLKISTDLNYKVFAQNVKTVSLLAYATYAAYDFFDNITNASLGYSELTNELFINNYVLNLKTLFNYKSSVAETKSYNMAGLNYSILGGVYTYLYNLKRFAATQVYKDILIITAPIKIGNDERLKRINRLIMRGSITTGTNKYFTLSIWGSIDNENYQFLLGTQETGTFKDLGLGRISPSCKYYVILLSGNISPNSFISGIDVDYQTIEDKKIR